MSNDSPRNAGDVTGGDPDQTRPIPAAAPIAPPGPSPEEPTTAVVGAVPATDSAPPAPDPDTSDADTVPPDAGPAADTAGEPPPAPDAVPHPAADAVPPAAPPVALPVDETATGTDTIVGTAPITVPVAPTPMVPQNQNQTWAQTSVVPPQTVALQGIAAEPAAVRNERLWPQLMWEGVLLVVVALG
ncbi:MAG: hypothetical protein ACRD0P_09840, partial [Stackebrandtia sp.]